MSAQCQHCQAKAQLFLCNVHIRELRTMLESLFTRPDDRGHPHSGLLQYLADAAVGHAKLGDGGRGTRTEPFYGDDALARHLELFPDDNEEDLDKAREQRRKAVQRRMLAIGRVNARAADLVDEVTNTLSTWVRDVCETRRVRFIPVRSVEPGFIGPLRPGWCRLPHGYTATPEDLAQWLAAHVTALASSEGAGECFGQIQQAIEDIERMVDRPVRRVWLGDCPTWNEHTRQTCGVSLWAPEDAVEVRCHRCRATHDPKRLKLLLFNDLERTKVPWEKILQANKSQPEDRQVPERTLQSWRRGKNGDPPKLTIRGYRRPDGRTVINRHSDEDVPLYLWPDVRKLRDAKPQKAPTGAAARQRVAT